MLCVLVLLMFATVPANGQQQQPAPGVETLSLEKQAALGKSMADEFRRRVPLVEDETLLAAVEKVAARLNEVARAPFALNIQIARAARAADETVGIPGGYLFVPVQRLAGARDEREVIKQLAHALAHVVSPWVAQPGSAGRSNNLAPVPLIFVGGCTGDHGESRALLPLAFRKAWNEHEDQITRLADEWLAQPGLTNQAFGPGEFATMRERANAIVAQEKPAPPSLFRKRLP